MTNAEPGRGRDLVVVGASAGGVEALREALFYAEMPRAGRYLGILGGIAGMSWLIGAWWLSLAARPRS